jgi:hypothetical protein
MALRGRTRDPQPRRNRGFQFPGLLVPLTVASLVAAGCQEVMDSSRLGPDGRPYAGAVRMKNQSRFQPNTVRYSDRGIRPAVGREGTATVAAQAVDLEAGRVRLTVTAGSTRPMPAALRTVLLRGYDEEGALRWVRTERPRSTTSHGTYDVPGLPPGGHIDVQAHVEEVGVRRVYVVRVTTPVLAAPNLRVESVTAPEMAVAGAAVNISALIRETNGELGAQADCVLRVDGTEVDRARGVWVDAGSTVSCVFTHIFEATGPKALEVGLMDIVPADANSSDNALSAAIMITAPPQSLQSDFSFTASVEDRSFSSMSRMVTSYRSKDGSTGDDVEMESGESGRTRDVRLLAWRGGAVEFPVAGLRLSHSTGTETAHAIDIAHLPASWTMVNGELQTTCGIQAHEGEDGLARLNVCAYRRGGATPAEWTEVGYEHHAGEVSYYSSFYMAWWNDWSGPGMWSSNDSGGWQIGRFPDLGPVYYFELWLLDGVTEYASAPAVSLEPFAEHEEEPWSCVELEDDWGVTTLCGESFHTATGVRGTDSWEVPLTP